MKKILIANRGEIALRIIKACRKAGIKSVAIFSEADRHSRHVWMADEAVCIGPANSTQSYLDIERILFVAKATGADAIHPGYGFLAENSRFARACAEAGLIFVGPSADMIDLMGDKIMARQAASRAGVRVVPGTETGFSLADLAQAKAMVHQIGFPLLLKAAAGGGGRGMRVVRSIAEFEDEFRQATREAEAAFGDGTIYLERYFDKARHIEVQVLSDRHGRHIHLGERDCTIQRRHQKLIEESPSPAITAAERKEVCDMAVALTRTLQYENAGTVEFLYDTLNGGFYFIEMNTRIQVEHPVSEMVTGVDIVYEQLRIASGKKMQLKKSGVKTWNHAIEWRINAEDAANGFQPSPGKITEWRCCLGSGTRLDSHVYPGYEVPTFYDSLLGKLVVGGHTREEAIYRSRQVINTFDIEGVSTTMPFYLLLMEQPEFKNGGVYTRWVDDNIGRLYEE
ncbi:acetyl-CoA carboxylase biotin carboxylase subunit [Halomonas daqingensis]|uniref:acetyl-CoA carboxylase biotin carboxylase subunit n=1 Tax=Billgrantia desiderata TaxID=52021 RepID=UPI001F3F0F23|nr:acetyl-CoA carboxylase biotin carboxylase subunit [Halomonas desiderata]MCE8028679.1 acetyl-CoA carboxylase biotin carboxylase subunit [Halomonas desiderata]